MLITNLPEFKYQNGTELTAKLCYFRKQAPRLRRHKFLDLKTGFSLGTKRIKRVLVLVGEIYDDVKKHGQYISDVPYSTDVLYAAHVLTRFMKGKIKSRKMNRQMVVYNKYSLIRPLLLAWKKGSLSGFPRDIIRYTADFLVYD